VGVCTEIIVGGLVSSNTTAPGLFWPVGSSDRGSAGPGSPPEARRAIVQRTAGTFSKLYCYAESNTNNTTVTFRKNSAAGNQTISIVGTTSGNFQDAVHTDSVVAGDTVDCAVLSTSGGSTAIYAIAVLFDTGTSNTTQRLAIQNFSVLTTPLGASTPTVYGSPGYFTLDTVESHAQFKSKCSGSLKNLQIYVASNGTTAATTLATRINSANGSTVSIAAAVTGNLENTSANDTVSVGTLVDYSLTSSGLAGKTFWPIFVSSEFTNTGNNFLNIGGANNLGVSSGATYGGVTGASGPGGFIESRCQSLFLQPATLSNLGIRVYSTSAPSATLRSRINAANGNLVISIAGNTSGYFEDTTHNDSVAATDEVCLYLATDATPSGVFQFGVVAIQASTPFSYTPHLLCMMGMGG
jgi:hypothetical protein